MKHIVEYSVDGESRKKTLFCASNVDEAVEMTRCSVMHHNPKSKLEITAVESVFDKTPFGNSKTVKSSFKISFDGRDPS